MRTRPAITVGIPFHNAESTLEAAIGSVLAQDLADRELLLVDDGSTDASLSIAGRFASDRVRVLADGERRGLAARLNQIAATASADLLARMDADDLMLPDRLARQVAYLHEHPACDLVAGGAVIIDADGAPQALRPGTDGPVPPRRLFAGSAIIHPTVAGRTGWFREHPYDESYGVSEDFELWTRVAAEAAIHGQAEPVLFYREYGTLQYEKVRRQAGITRRLVRARGPGVLGRPRTALLLLRRAAIDAFYRTASALGIWDWALRVHHTPLREEERQRWTRLMDEALARGRGEGD